MFKIYTVKLHVVTQSHWEINTETQTKSTGFFTSSGRVLADFAHTAYGCPRAHTYAELSTHSNLLWELF